MKKLLVISYFIARTWCLFESIRKPEEGCAFQKSTRSVPDVLVLWITWGRSLRKKTGNCLCGRGEMATKRLIYLCFSVLMLCDWLILTWHLPTLELIERVTQISHIWGFKEGWSNENNIVCTGVFFPQPLIESAFFFSGAFSSQHPTFTSNFKFRYIISIFFFF